jgi:AcrR family transcriptional regulator
MTDSLKLNSHHESAVASLTESIPLHVRDRLSPVVKDLYAAGDFHRVDMRTIAREAGMSFRTIYRYFGDKETLLFWFIKFWLEELYAPVMKGLDSNASLRPKLLSMLTLHFEFYEKNPNVGRIIFMTVPLDRWMRDPSFAQSALMKRVLKLIREGQLQGELRADIDSLVIFDVVNAVFNRAFLMWEYRHRSYSLVEQAAPLLSIVWNGISAHSRQADGPDTVAAAVDGTQGISKRQRSKSQRS